MLNYNGLPESLRGGMQRYFEHGIEPGSFLMAVLANNLIGAFACADENNRARMFEIVSWIYNEAPRGACGSVTICQRYMEAVKAEAAMTARATAETKRYS